MNILPLQCPHYIKYSDLVVIDSWWHIAPSHIRHSTIDWSYAYCKDVSSWLHFLFLFNISQAELLYIWYISAMNVLYYWSISIAESQTIRNLEIWRFSQSDWTRTRLLMARSRTSRITGYLKIQPVRSHEGLPSLTAGSRTLDIWRPSHSEQMRPCNFSIAT